MQHATQSYARNQTAILMIAIAAALVAGAASAASSNQFLLLNYSPSGSFSPSGSDSANVMGYVAGKFGAANHASELKVGVSCLYIPGWNSSASELALMTNDLAQAELLGIPILVQVDTETWLPTSLLNWYDSGLPGYDTNKVADVEWYGWDSTNAIKLSWRNWGSPFRIGPTPNFLSTNFQAYEKSIYDVFIPKVLQWYANLPANKKWLFVGWKCGWESAINSNYRFFPDGNSYYGTSSNPSWSDSYQPLGYNAAKTAGIRTNGIVTTDDNARIVGRHLAYLAKLAVDAGIPRDKVSVHGTTYGTYQQDMDALVNSNGNPGASWYGGDSLKSNTAFSQAVQTAKASYGATGYGYGEFNLFTSDYNTWYSWLQNTLHGDPDCVYQALYNFDTMKDVSSVEQAMLDAMALYPVPPLSVVLDRPTDYGMFMVGSSVPATATVANGTLPYTVAFYTNCAGGAYWQAGTTNASPYTVNLGALALGTYGIYATVTDGTNGAAISATNTFTVQVAPSDNAGSGGTITYTDSNGLNPRSSPPYTDGYVVHTFTNAGTSMLTLPIAVTGSVMVVAGGGGGGWNCLSLIHI